MVSRKGLRLCALLIATAALSAPAAAEEDELPVAPDDLVYCTVCHGVQLMGNDILKAPRLSGLSAWYVENQLRAFRRGWRGTHPEDYPGMEMRPMAAGLSDRGIERAAEFASATRSPQPVATLIGDGGDVDEGRRLYASCAACHGADGAGRQELGAPALTGQNDWYLIHQLENYRSGKRGYAAEDSLGQQMRAAVELLDGDEAVQDIVKYITTLQSNTEEGPES